VVILFTTKPFAAVLAVLLTFLVNSMEQPPAQPKESTQTQPTADSQSNLTKFVPIRSFPHVNSIESNKPWYHLFRPSLLGPNSIPPSQSQSPQLETFQFCQSRLITSTEDLSKLIQNVSSIFTQDKTSLETLIGSARELIEITRDENNTRHDSRMKESTSPPITLFIDS